MIGRIGAVLRKAARIVALAAGAAIAGLSVAAPARATPLPDHAVVLVAETALCQVAFRPDATTGDSPPQLRVTADMLTGRLSVELSGGPFTEQVFLWNINRQDFRAIVSAPPDRLADAPLWQDLATAAAQGASVYFTVRDGLGAYSSARYDALPPEQIARTVALACDVDLPGFVPASPVEALRAERRLDLAEADIAHIRRVLASRFGEPGVQPGREPAFTITDRRLIGIFNGTPENPGQEYLTRDGALALLAEQPQMPQTAPPPEGAEIVATFRDWTVYSERGGQICSIGSPAQSATGYAGATVPVMRFAVDRTATGGLMVFELTRPNPFAPGAVVAVFDGQPVDLFVEPSTGALAPRPLADGRLSNEFMLLLRQGQSVTIEGIANDSGLPLVLEYSAFGFTAAFREMAQLCNRPGILGWIG